MTTDLKAEERLRQIDDSCTHGAEYDDYGPCKACLIAGLRAHAHAALEAAAKVICKMCRDGDKLEFGVPPGENPDVRPVWFHTNPTSHGWESRWDLCRAAAIRALREGE